MEEADFLSNTTISAGWAKLFVKIAFPAKQICGSQDWTR